MKDRRIALLAASSILLAACGNQAPERPTPPGPVSFAEVGDSAGWFEEIDSRTEVVTPDDTIEASLRIAGAVHMRRQAPDTLRAFFEALFLHRKSPLADSRPDTRAILGRAFLLEETDSGLVTIQAPGISNEAFRMADLRTHFEDFFPVDFDLSRARPAGEAWEDTIIRRREVAGVSSSERSTVVRYRSAGDTIWRGIPSRTVRYTADVRTTTTIHAQPGPVESVLEGREEGVILYAPARALMVEWRRSGETDGYTRSGAPGENAIFPQRHNYGASTRLLTGPEPPTGEEPTPAAAADRPPT